MVPFGNRLDRRSIIRRISSEGSPRWSVFESVTDIQLARRLT